MLISRRLLIAGAPALAAIPRPAWAQTLARGAFTHGVASGDPLPDGVILWTRFVGADDSAIAWEVAEDEGFATVARRGDAFPSFANDFCVKIDVRGLAPGRRYFYRFLSGSGASPTGHTCTAPQAGADSLAVALFSCSNFAFGYFHAYRHAATRADVDLVLHVGDYIYEYGRGVYPSATEAVAARIIDPVTEIVRLSDYYQRYATYHADPDLQELRRVKPMSVVWDDHEFANDTWRDGAQNHQPDREGDFLDRVAAASKAYFDWMPIRRPDPRGGRIYRSLDWGDLARIVLLDTRYTGRGRQLDYRTALSEHLAQGDGTALATFRDTVLRDPNRTLLGAAQETWLSETLAQSKQRGQTWQILAQQVVMGEQRLPPGISRLLPADAHANTRRWVASGEQAAQHDMPWNLDSWGGYPAARTRLLNTCAANANNTIVLAGDSHNCWLNNLAAPEGQRLAAIEFAGGSVTSPGFERTYTNAAPGEREAALRAGNPELAWCDASRRGYGVLRFTRTACSAEWLAFDNVRTQQMSAPTITRINAAASMSAGPDAWAVQGA